MSGVVSMRVAQPGKVMSSLLRRSKKFRSMALNEFTLGASEFIQEMREKHYDGRPGVKQQTGDLYKDWFEDITVTPHEIVATIYNTRKYSRYHEFPDEAPKIPRRTFVTDDINGTIGKKIFEGAIINALRRAF